MIQLDYSYRSIRFILIACMLTVFGSPTLVEAQQGFHDWAEKYEEGYAEYRENFENGVANSEEAYEEYREAYEEEFQKFKEEMQKKWGDFRERTKKKWVEYKENGKLCVSADFEKGSAKVEVLADSKEEAERIKKEMPEKTAEALKSKGTREGFETKKLPNKEVTEEPVLDDQLPKSEDETVDEYAKKVAEKETKTKEVKGDDGKTRYVVYVDLKLANNHVQKRAQKVEDDVYKFAEEYNIDPALVFAIIHVESYFNPTAASHANAYGLMQLVPSTGGRDAYRRIFKKDGIPTKEFLFKPGNNIQMGCTFIDILTSNYFSRAKDSKTRQYLMISAYNTGAGNVAVAYTGDTSLSTAFPKINKMSPEENYDFLRKNLEYAEARNYLKKVTSRRKQYNEWKVKAKE
ncbi:murein transglycosylase domain-containing protein [Fodinibius halophilus]|uniref:Transglycosylase SLT domain-containing protein n=1 Tax=Fodinibius halophilus TaxID=1736908 RepID=A0A6M1TB19_9BACT|nr:murein transglycosylase domain-containing protein [Fodinibius halophilus]NGP87532.1 transglycosylase SLT domain-containing protein [Fodinibius halophilus]